MKHRSEPEILIIDDDPSMRTALQRLLHSVGFRTRAFSCAPDFLSADFPPGSVGCLVLDVEMPGMSGIDLQAELRNRGLSFPIVFITGHGTIPMSVQAMKHGAVDFLPKPFDENDLIRAISGAMEKGREDMGRRLEMEDLRLRFGTLTPREQEVFQHVVAGMLNKQIASALGTSEKTIKVHRARVMEKMQAQSLAELVRMAGKIGVCPP